MPYHDGSGRNVFSDRFLIFVVKKNDGVEIIIAAEDILQGMLL